jgi:hypothetical protein
VNPGGTPGTPVAVDGVTGRLKTDSIVDRAGTGAVDFPNGATGITASISDFALNAPVDPDMTISGGNIQLADGRRIATYDGLGGDSGDYGADLSIDLDVVYGSPPANAETYYLYIDLGTLPSTPVVLGDTGSEIYGIEEGNFVLKLTAPEDTDLHRFLPLGYIRSGNTGNAWDGTGSKFGSVATKRHDKPVSNVSPVVWESDWRSVGTVGAVENEQGSLNDSDFSGTFHFWDLVGNANDNSSGGGADLSPQGSPEFNSLGFFGRENIYNADGSDDELISTTNSDLNPTGTFSMGGWFKYENSGTFMVLFGNDQGNPNRGWALLTDDTSATGLPQWRWRGSTDADGSCNDWDVTWDTVDYPENIYGKWTHFVLTFDDPNDEMKIYINGKFFDENTVTEVCAPTSYRFSLAGSNLSNFYKGQVQDAFVATGTELTPAQINAIYSRRYAGKQLAGGHVLDADSFPLDDLSGKISFFNLDNDDGGTILDDSTNTNNLTKTLSPSFTEQNIFGEAKAFRGSSGNYINSTATFFNPADEVYTVGGWFFNDQWDLDAFQSAISQNPAGGDRGFRLVKTSGGSQAFSWQATDTANPGTQIAIVNKSMIGITGWHHIAMSYDTTKIIAYWDGVRVGTATLTDHRATSSPTFEIGTMSSGVSAWVGNIQDVFFSRELLSDNDIKKLASARIDIN